MSISVKKQPIDWQNPDPQWMEVAGKRLEARVWGPPPAQAMTIVMLHEGLGAVSLWRDFPAALSAATGCGVLAYSRAGYGQSDGAALPWPLDYMTREALDVLPHVLDQAGVRRAVLLGHSDGASIAAIHAGRVRDVRVCGLCLMAPHFFTEETGLASIRAARKAWEGGDLGRRLGRYHRDAENAFLGWNGAWLDPGFRSWNIEDVIGGISVPVLAIQGRDDQYGSLAQIEALKARLATPPRVQIFEACRHSPYLDQPGRTTAALVKFMDDLAEN